MTQRAFVVLGTFLVLAAAPCIVAAAPAPFSLGFGAGVPCGLPVDWARSFSYLTAEAFLSPSLTTGIDLGTYPADFPNMFESTIALLVKAWFGPANVFAGGGFTWQWRRVAAVWGYNPYLTLKGGVQFWIVDSVAFIAQFRTHDPMPLHWTFNPEFSLGMTVAIGGARPDPPVCDPATMWLLVGLGVAALIAFLPRQ
jgi:hypothetical protein